MRYFLVFASIIVFGACSSAPNPAEQVNHLADRYVEAYFTTFPEEASMLGAPDLHPSKLSNPSFSVLNDWHATEDQLLTELNAIDMDALDGLSEHITYGFLRELLEASIYLRTCRMGLWKASPTYTGWQNSLPFAFSSQPLETEEQRDNLYERLNQIEIISQQFSEIGKRSFGTSDPAEVLKIVKDDSQYRFSSREEIIQMAEETVERAEAELPKWFGLVPEMKVDVVPYPSFQEKNAPLGQAIPPSRDGKIAGQYIINTYQPETQSKSFIESLSIHEAHPGHLFQVYVSQTGAEIHPITSYFFLSGFGEGWALYAERLAEEMGLYTSDMSRVGWLASEAHRSARLVVDSGMHALGWTRQQSIDYLARHTTLTPNQTVAETDRYIATPGQASSYMVGALEIMALRSEAEQALGDDFDIKAFHDIVLEDGTVPLAMLRVKVEGWIANQ